MNIVVMYCGDLHDVAEAFGEAAEHLSARVRVLRVPGEESEERGGAHPDVGFGDLEWADGIAVGTPSATVTPRQRCGFHRGHRAAVEQRMATRQGGHRVHR